MDLLVEAADSVGRLLKAEAEQARSREQLMSLVTKIERGEVDLQAGAQDLLPTMETQLDGGFERMVEQCLQHLADYTYLGQSELAAELLIQGSTHIERGRALRAVLLEAIESLRPVGARPSGMPPREWHPYLILSDAYVEDVPNREIESRLYIAETTFHRQRRNARRAIARTLLETMPRARGSGFETLPRPDPAAGG